MGERVISKQVNLRGVSVMLGMPCGPSVPWQTALSLVSTQTLMQDKGIGFQICMSAGSSIVDLARNQVAHLFLDSEHTRLFWIDSDIVWNAHDFLKMVARSTQMECVGATYLSKTEDPKFQLGSPPGEPNEFECWPVDGFGLGFTIVSRRVMEALADKAPQCQFLSDPKPRPRIFRCDITDDGVFRGEDMAFFADIREMGVQPYIDPSVVLGHVGQKIYTGSIACGVLEPPTLLTRDAAA